MNKLIALTLLLPTLALATRDSTGKYQLPSGNPVPYHGTITSAWANTTLADIRDALTDSLSRSGNGGMTSAFQLLDGSTGAPGLSFVNSVTTGVSRDPATGAMTLSVAGNPRLRLETTGLVGLINTSAVSLKLRQAPSQVADLTLTLPAAAPSAEYAVAMATDGTLAPKALTTAHLSPTAGIVGTQLSASAGIVGSQLSATAGILGSQLAASAGVLGSQLDPAAGVANTQLASPVIVRGSAITWSNSSTSATKLGNVTITTHGRPVLLFFVPSNAGMSPSSVTSSSIQNYCVVNLYRGDVTTAPSLSSIAWGALPSAGSFMPASTMILDTGAGSGSTIYSAWGFTSLGGYTCTVTAYNLIAWEL